MGKRELLLIGGFVLVGILVYAVTAPEPAPDQQRFSIGKLIEGLRREVRGNRASAEVRSSRNVPLSPAIGEIRFETASATLAVSGEDRADVGLDLLVWSNGSDDADAKKYATETSLVVREVGRALVVSIDYPEPGQQRATLTVRVPKGLDVRVQQSRGKLDVGNVVTAEIADARGQVTVRGVSGRLVAGHRGGTLNIEQVGELKLSTRGSNVSLRDVKAQTSLQLQAGELRGSAIAGPLEVESNGTQIELDEWPAIRKPMRFSTIGGSLTIAGLASELRIDARDTKLDVAIAKPAPVEIYADGDLPMAITVPATGFDIEAVAIDGRLTVPEGFAEVKTTGNEQRLRAAIGGGGPKVTLRTSRGEITVRSRKPDG
jgi:putative adhesin